MMWRQSISLVLVLCFGIPFGLVAVPLSLKHTDIYTPADMRRYDPRAERPEEREQSEGDQATD